MNRCQKTLEFVTVQGLEYFKIEDREVPVPYKKMYEQCVLEDGHNGHHIAHHPDGGAIEFE